MFIAAMFLMSVGYAVFYYGGSMAKGYNRDSPSGEFDAAGTKGVGGIPLAYLLGIPIDPNKMKSNPTQYLSFPPFKPPNSATPNPTVPDSPGGTGQPGSGFQTPTIPQSPESGTQPV